MFNPKKVASAIATSALIFNTLATSAFATTNVTVSGNGDSSSNTATVTNNQETKVVQSNTAVISNSVSSNTNTGGNTASRNTGGHVTVDTGNAGSQTTVTNSANMNSADLSNCNCENGDTKVEISGNGVESRNKASVTDSRNSGTELFQNNTAVVTNKVDSYANTGDNNANRNTGGTGLNAAGNTKVITGDAYSKTNISTQANANVATVGGGSSSANAGTQALITGNGDSSRNTIRLSDNHELIVVQDNTAVVLNAVSNSATTGYNDANRNTGTNVTIDTGNAFAETNVDNMVNFNSANVDCECVLGGGLKVEISGNGVESVNKVSETDNGGLSIFQGGRNGAGNVALLTNSTGANADTGLNDAGRNTGPVSIIDPVDVYTGNAGSLTNVSNEGNVNVVGSPVALGSHSLVFSWDLGSLFWWL